MSVEFLALFLFHLTQSFFFVYTFFFTFIFIFFRFITTGLPNLNDVLGISLLSNSLLPALMELAKDTKWRVRLAIIEEIPRLAGRLGQDFFNDKVCVTTLSWLGDEVSSIRTAAGKNLSLLSAVFGITWTREKIVGEVVELSGSQGFSRRLTAVRAAAAIGERFCNPKNGDIAVDGEKDSIEFVCNTILPIILSLAGDPVPNIRFNVAKSIPICLQNMPQEAVNGTMALKCLEVMMNEDHDSDVRFFAKEARGVLVDGFNKE